jgi:hypothetical protein
VLIHSYHREASEEIAKAIELEKNNNPNYGQKTNADDRDADAMYGLGDSA